MVQVPDNPYQGSSYRGCWPARTSENLSDTEWQVPPHLTRGLHLKSNQRWEPLSPRTYLLPPTSHRFCHGLHAGPQK